MKQTAVKLLRQAHLLSTVEAVRYGVSTLKSARDNRIFCRENPGIALPPKGLMHDALSHVQYREYIAGGKKAAATIVAVAKQYLGSRPITVCEWGCGPGRIVRHLADLLPVGSKVYGTDYNSKSIAWCSANLPSAEFRVNNLAPPLPLEIGQIDLLYAISIFTHLSEKMHYEWFKEILRVVKPGGVILLTVHGNDSIAGLNGEELASYQAGHLVVRGNVKEGSRIYASYESPRYMRETLLRDVEILAYNPEHLRMTFAGGQEVYVLRRP